MSIVVKEFFHKPTFTLSYVVFDSESLDAVLIDPAMDYFPNTSEFSYKPLFKIDEFIQSKKLKLHYVIETHMHADHLTGASWFKEKYPDIQVIIHENIKIVQETFQSVFQLPHQDNQGLAFDYLVKDNEELQAGSIRIKVIHTPGHTPACACYLINNQYLFTGDLLFMADSGTGRCDFPKGSAQDMYESIIKKIYSLDDQIEYYTGHDYQPHGRSLQFKEPLLKAKNENVKLNINTKQDEFIKNRNERDATLEAPRLILPSLQINMNAGRLPEKNERGSMFLKLPFIEKS